MSIDRVKVGLISDTHGLLRPQAQAVLRDCSVILHAGDIGEGVLEKLRSIADTVVAVRGNTDVGTWAQRLRLTEQVEVVGLKFHIVHDLVRFPVVPPDTHVVVHGHSHRWSCVHEDGIWYINPGSAGPRRFTLPITLGVAEIVGSSIRFERIEIEA